MLSKAQILHIKLNCAYLDFIKFHGDDKKVFNYSDAQLRKHCDISVDMMYMYSEIDKDLL